MDDKFAQLHFLIIYRENNKLYLLDDWKLSQWKITPWAIKGWGDSERIQRVTNLHGCMKQLSGGDDWKGKKSMWDYQYITGGTKIATG
jgi:hypothetical protein